MTTLTDFLLARIAEDEAVARAAMPGPWASLEIGQESVIKAADGEPLTECGDGHSGLADMADARHLVRHDPVRVLAECEAKRACVWAWQRVAKSAYIAYDSEDLQRGDRLDAQADGLGEALRFLALPYADHADYNEAWRP